MLLEQERNSVETRGMMAVASATIKATPKVFSFFADQTYADKPLAICRELVSNAIDAHTAAGIPDVPIQVWLPTDLDPMFRVKDQGIGMSHEFMMTGFLAYTDGSTKDGSNDQIGGFGIGSKSPFAYTDQYTLRVAHNGTLSIYAMFKNEDGIPSLGVMSQTPTSEANGVEVNFPVEVDDFNKFHTAAQKGLQHFKPMPTIYGGTVTAPVYVTTNQGWGMREAYGSLNVIMGGVCYPVDSYNLEYDLRYDEKVRDLLSFGLDITMPIGSCGVALSRESLSYDVKTSEAIRARLHELVDEITASFSTMFDHHPTLWQAALALNLEVGNTGGGRGKFLADRALYQGASFESSFRVPLITWLVETPTYRRGRTNEKLTAKWEGSEKTYVRPGNYEAVIIDDLPQVAHSKTIMRIKDYVKNHLPRTKSSLVLRPWGDETIADVLKSLGNMPRSAYILTSELDVPVAEKRVTSHGIRPKVRMFTYNGYVSGNNNQYRVGIDNPGVDEIAYADQPDEGILVVMTNFEIPSDLRRMVDTGLLNWSELLWVNSGDAPKLKGDEWQSYADVFKERLAEALASAPNLGQMLALYHDGALRDIFRLVGTIRNTELTAAQQARPFGKIFNLYKKYIQPLSDDHRRLSAYVTTALPPRLNTQAMVDTFNTKQPRAARLAELLRYGLVAETDRQFFLELI